MFHRIKKIISGELFKAGAFMSFINVLASLASYLYQVICGRYLTPAEYGLFSAIMASAALLGSPLSAAQMLISKRVSEVSHATDVFGAAFLCLRLSKIVFFVTIALALMSLGFLEEIKSYLRSESTFPIILMICYIVFVSGNQIILAFLQGTRKYLALGISILGGPFARLLMGFLFISWGLKVSGAVGGVAGSAAIIWIIGYLYMRRYVDFARNSKIIFNANGLLSALPVLAANICFAVMTQIDIILVKLFFSAEIAGVYAAASVLGKAVLYIPGGFVVALYPITVFQQMENRSSNLNILKEALFITTLLCGAVGVIFYIYSNELILFIYGSSYISSANILKWYGFSILPLTLVMVCEHYLIAKGRTLFTWLFIAIAPFQLVSISIFHSDVNYVMASIFICGILLLAGAYGANLVTIIGRKDIENSMV